MIGGITQFNKMVFDDFGLDVSKSKLIFCRSRKEKYGMPIIDLRFTLDLQVIRIPYNTRLDYQTFLNSGYEKDLPEGIKLEDLLLSKK